MLNNVSGVQRNERHIGPRQKTVYINIGGIDGDETCMKWLEGRSLYVEGRYSSTLPMKQSDAGKSGQYKVHAADDADLAPQSPSSASAFSLEGDAALSAEEVVLTTARMTASDHAAIWNQTFQVRVPLPLPKSLRLAIYATSHSGEIIRVADSFVGLAALLDQKKRGPEDVLHLSPATKLSFPLWVDQSPSLREAQKRNSGRKPRNSSNFMGSMRSPHGTARSSLDASPKPGISRALVDIEDEKSSSEADRFNDSSAESVTPSRGQELRATFAGRRSQEASRDKLSRVTQISGMFTAKRQAKLQDSSETVGEDALKMYQSMPEVMQLGLAIVTNPKRLGSVEAMWDMRIVAQNRGIRLMERPWFILSPTNWKVLYWQVVILMAMLYVSTVTPVEVTVMNDTPFWLKMVNYGFDFIFFIDMSLQFFQGYHDAELKQMVYVSIKLKVARASSSAR